MYDLSGNASKEVDYSNYAHNMVGNSNLCNAFMKEVDTRHTILTRCMDTHTFPSKDSNDTIQKLKAYAIALQKNEGILNEKLIATKDMVQFLHEKQRKLLKKREFLLNKLALTLVDAKYFHDTAAPSGEPNIMRTKKYTQEEEVMLKNEVLAYQKGASSTFTSSANDILQALNKTNYAIQRIEFDPTGMQPCLKNCKKNFVQMKEMQDNISVQLKKSAAILKELRLLEELASMVDASQDSVASEG